MSAYTIVRGKVTDMQRFVAYIKAVPAVVEQYGGRYLVQGGELEILEGPSDESKIVIHLWPDAEAARAFWSSPEYLEVKRLREGAGEFQVALIEGVENLSQGSEQN